MAESNLIISQDGSHTIYSEQFDVSYHSKYGALQETDTVFIQAGLKHVAQRPNINSISILEMGFGTGLNALMTLLSEYRNNIHIDYHTIEAYPIALNDAKSLNYPSVLGLTADQKKLFLKMHMANDNESIHPTDNFKFTKHITLLEKFETNLKFDLIYYDAFAPTSQDHLWTEEMMKKMASHTAAHGVLVTYCAKGSFKRALKAANFSVEGLPGPIGKREMTRATLI